MGTIFFSAVLLLLGGSMAKTPAQGSGVQINDPTLTIAVKNYAGVNAATLDKAEATATLIFQKAGVKTQWIDLTPPVIGRESTTALSSIFEVQVRIVASGMSEQLVDRDDIMGLAPGSGPGRQLVYVFYDRVEALVEKQKIARMEGKVIRYPDKAQMLGDLMAHELGHVLSNLRSHSTTGIMREDWNVRDLEDGGGSLLFTGPQAAVIRTEVARRLRQNEIVEVAEQLKPTPDPKLEDGGQQPRLISADGPKLGEGRTSRVSRRLQSGAARHGFRGRKMK